MATSDTSESSTPRRASSLARYWAFAASFRRRMRPQMSSSQPKFTLTLLRLRVAVLLGGRYTELRPRDQSAP